MSAMRHSSLTGSVSGLESGLARRSLLKGAGLGAVVLAGGSFLAACGSGGMVVGGRGRSL